MNEDGLLTIHQFKIEDIVKKKIQTSFVVIFALGLYQYDEPDFSRKEDLAALGAGRLVEKDGSVIRNMKLMEVNEYWIVFMKNESLHDMMMERIARIEFPDSRWNAIVVTFPGNKATVDQTGD